MIALDPAARFAFVPDLGNNAIFVYAFDGDTGQLVPDSEVSMPDGSGPRHMAFHSSGRFAFVLNELNNTVTTMAWVPTTGGLQPLGTTNLLFDDARARRLDRGGAAEIATSADGRFVYTTVRLGRDVPPLAATPAVPFGVECN